VAGIGNGRRQCADQRHHQRRARQVIRQRGALRGIPRAPWTLNLPGWETSIARR
jgi:hypothetical protein